MRGRASTVRCSGALAVVFALSLAGCAGSSGDGPSTDGGSEAGAPGAEAFAGEWSGTLNFTGTGMANSVTDPGETIVAVGASGFSLVNFLAGTNLLMPGCTLAFTVSNGVGTYPGSLQCQGPGPSYWVFSSGSASLGPSGTPLSLTLSGTLNASSSSSFVLTANLSH